MGSARRTLRPRLLSTVENLGLAAPTGSGVKGHHVTCYLYIGTGKACAGQSRVSASPTLVLKLRPVSTVGNLGADAPTGSTEGGERRVSEAEAEVGGP